MQISNDFLFTSFSAPEISRWYYLPGTADDYWMRGLIIMDIFFPDGGVYDFFCLWLEQVNILFYVL